MCVLSPAPLSLPQSANQNLLQSSSGGYVSLVLVQGPSENVVPIDCIKDNVSNTGQYVWDVPTWIKPDVTHYGIKIIQVGTGAYQYSTQFGIKNPSYSSSSSAPISASTSAQGQTSSGVPISSIEQSAATPSKVGTAASHLSSYATGAGSVLSSHVVATGAPSSGIILPSSINNNNKYNKHNYNNGNSSQTYYYGGKPSAYNNGIGGGLGGTGGYALPTGTGIASTGFAGNVSQIQPTVPMSVPATLGAPVTQPAAVATGGSNVASGAGSVSLAGTTRSSAGSAGSAPAPAPSPTGAASAVVSRGLLAGVGVVVALFL